MSRSNETSGVELVVVGVFAFCLAVVAWLMKTFDVEWQTALETAPGLIVWLLVVGAGIFFGIKMETGLVRWGAIVDTGRQLATIDSDSKSSVSPNESESNVCQQ